MQFGSRSNQAPGLPAASRACPAAPPAGSSGACFHPTAAAKTPASHRFPAPRQPAVRRGLSIPAPHQKKLRAARARCVRRPAPLRARSGKQPARRSVSSGPPRIQNRVPALRPHLAAALRIPAKPLSPRPPRALRCAPRKTPFPFGCSKFFLGDHDSRSGPFIRGKFAGNCKAASPDENAAARQYRPAIALPPADTLLIQQALQLVGASVTLWAQPVAGAPVAQHQREAQSVAVQNCPISTSFPSLGRPVNHPEAEYAPQFRNIHFRVAFRQIDLVLIFVQRRMRTCPFRLVHAEKHKCVSFFSYFYSARQNECTPVLSAVREFEHRFNVVSAQLARAWLDALHHPAHDPLAQCCCPLCLLGVLRVLRVLCVQSLFLRRLE